MDYKVHDIDAEKMIIGILLSADARSDEKHSVINLNKDDFYLEQHKEIIEIAKEQFKNTGNFDMITISSAVDQNKGAAVTFEYLLEIVEDSMIVVTTFDTLFKRIKEKSEIRKVAKETTELLQGKMSFDEYKIKINEIDIVKTNEEISNESLVMKVYEKISEFDRDKYQVQNIKTGFKKIDDRLLINRKDFIVLAARQSTGKTAFVLNVVKNNPGKSIVYFSNDATAETLMERYLGIRSFNNTKKTSKINFDNLFKTALETTKENLYFYDNFKTVEDMMSKAREVKKQHGLDLIIVDYLQRIKGKGKSKTERVSQSAEDLDEMGKILDVPIIAISAINRDSSKSEREPIMEDLKDSGDIEFYSKAIVLLYSPYAATGEGKQNEVRFILAKQKEGEAFKETMYFDKETLTFSEFDLSSKNREEK